MKIAALGFSPKCPQPAGVAEVAVNKCFINYLADDLARMGLRQISTAPRSGAVAQSFEMSRRRDDLAGEILVTVA